MPRLRDQPADIRLALLHGGYMPLPCSGKRPVLPDWPHMRVDDAGIAQWSVDFVNAHNTGALAATVPGVDIDIRDAKVAGEVEAMVRRRINGGTMLVRTGLAPKRLIPFRASTPFAKISTPVFISPDGIEHKVEIPGDGQQYIVAGIHPDTGKPYTWSERALWEVPRSALPELTAEMAVAIIVEATAILERTGWPVKPSEAKAKPKQKQKQKAYTGPKREGDAAQISQQLANRIEDLCAALLPAGRQVGHEFEVGSLGGEPGQSLRVRLDGDKAGVWSDFATGESGDALDLVAAVKGCGAIDAMDWSRTWLGQPAFEARKKPGAGSRSQPETRPPSPYSSLNPPFPHMKAPPPAKPGEPAKRALPRATLANARVAIRAMQVDCRYDEFHDCYLIDHAAQEEGPLTDDAGALSDGALLLLRLWVERAYGFDPGEQHINDAARQLGRESRFDPVRDYLAGLRWDEVERLDTWLVTYLGAKDTPLHRAFGRLTLVAAVRRARQPGCKKDEVLVLEGPEGKDKSTAILVLAGGEAYFSDQPILGLNDREQQERMRGAWLYEIADLHGMKKAEVDHVKAFCSRTHDRARPAYGRALVELPRRCVFLGTTNDETYLKSQTGNRRFWPVATGKIDIAALRRDRDQLWAEAVAVEATGVALTLPTELWAEAAEEQDARRVVDVWEERIDEYLAVRTETSLAEVLKSALEIPPSKQTQIEQNRVAACLRQLGFERYQKRDGKSRLWRYRR